MSHIAGIDPGKTGALALLDGGSGKLVEVVDMPVTDGVSPHGVADVLGRWADNFEIGFAVIEQVHSMPKQGVSTTFKFGVNYGIVLGVVATLSIPMRHAVPSKWTGDLKVGNDKEVHRQRCIEIWPEHYETFKLKTKDGRADAALLARWGLQIEPMT